MKCPLVCLHYFRAKIDCWAIDCRKKSPISRETARGTFRCGPMIFWLFHTHETLNDGEIRRFHSSELVFRRNNESKTRQHGRRLAKIIYFVHILDYY